MLHVGIKPLELVTLLKFRLLRVGGLVFIFDPGCRNTTHICGGQKPAKKSSAVSLCVAVHFFVAMLSRRRMSTVPVCFFVAILYRCPTAQRFTVILKSLARYHAVSQKW